MARKLTPLGKNAQYWKTRGMIAQMASNQNLENYKAETKKIFDEANDRINGKLKDLYVQFANEEGVSLDKAKKLLNSDELKNFKMSLNDYVKLGEEQNNHYSAEINKKLAEASLKYRVTRLEAIQYQLQLESNKLYKELDQHFSDWNKDEFRERYYRQLFDVFQKAGIGTSFAKINDQELNEILKKPWNGNRNFSQRLWEHKNDLIDKLQNSLSQSLINGYSYTQSSKELAKQLHTKNYNAARLITTESSFFDTRGQQKALEELGVERYQNVAVLDNETCPICRGMDLKTFKVSAMKIGKNAPPYHPNCRDTIVPYYNDKKLKSYVEGSRAARDDANGETYYVPANMKYDTWAKDFGIKDKDGNYIVEPDYEVIDESGNTLALGNFKKALKAKHYKKLEPLKKNNKDLVFNQLFNKHVPKTTVKYDNESPGHFSYARDEIAVNPKRADHETDYLHTLIPHEGTHAIDNYAYDDLLRGTKDYKLAGTLSETYKKGLLAKTINNDFDDLLTPIIKRQKNISKIPVGNKSFNAILQKLDKNNKLSEKDRERIASNLSRLLTEDELIDKKAYSWKQIEDQLDNISAVNKNDLISKLYKSISRKLPKNITVKDIENEYKKHLVTYMRMDDEPELEELDWKKALESLRNELRYKYNHEDLHSLSDMFQGYAENLAGKEASLTLNGTGHSTGYFRGPHMQSAEFLAEYYEDKLTNPKAYKVLKEVLPNACKIPEEMFKSALNKEAHKFAGFGSDDEFADFEIIEDEDELPIDITYDLDDEGEIVGAEVIEDIDGHYHIEDFDKEQLKTLSLNRFKNVIPQSKLKQLEKELSHANSDFVVAWNKHISKLTDVTINPYDEHKSAFKYNTHSINITPYDLDKYGSEVISHEGTHGVDYMSGIETFKMPTYFSHSYDNAKLQRTLNDEWNAKIRNLINDNSDLAYEALKNTQQKTGISDDDIFDILDLMEDDGKTLNEIAHEKPDLKPYISKINELSSTGLYQEVLPTQQNRQLALETLRNSLLKKYGKTEDLSPLSDMFQAYAQHVIGPTLMNLNGFGHNDNAAYFLGNQANQAGEFFAYSTSNEALNNRKFDIIKQELPASVLVKDEISKEMAKNARQ